jgi:ABC-type Fe3+/spermidine/putrescine transport system ATPase subunit
MGDLNVQELKLSRGSLSFTFTGNFAKNRWHILCGPSGSGKTTLFRMLSGLLTPDSGTIRLGEQNIGLRAPHQRNISVMTQANALFPGISVNENLLLALHDSGETQKASGDRILEVTEALDLDPTMLQRAPNELSGGQISRFNLARALLRPCSWLLLDEPFAAVDRTTRLGILTHLKRWQQSRTLGIILVSHDLDDILSVATDITVIEGGKIVESAPIDLAMARPSRKATAKALRSGAIISKSDRYYFLPAQDAHLSASAVKCEDRYLKSHRFKDARAIRLGAVLRILDLETDSDFTIPASQSFSGEVWYDVRRLSELQDHDRD